MSDTFRFHSPTNIAPDNTARRLLKRRGKRVVNPTLLAADRMSFRDSSGRWPIESYADLPRKSYVTLTCMEADLIALANPGIRPPLALELLHPWLPQQVYTEDAERNYDSVIAVVRKYGRHFVTPAAYCDEKWNTVCNSVRVKTDIDARFYTAWHLPVQDFYVLEEKRPNRCVLALDFNAMYPSCMQQKFPKPSKLRHVIYDREVEADEILPTGLYRCRLERPISDFITRYNPFRTFFAGRHLRPALGEGLSVDLHEFEFSFYQRHFERVFVLDAVVSDECISHPLAREERRLFARRAHYIANNNKALADREKFLSTLLASCTHRPGRLDQEFETCAAAEDFLHNDFGIAAYADDPAGLSAAWLQGRKAFTITETAEGVRCETPDVTSGRACFMFNQRIVARGRTILLEMMEKLLKIAPDVELCYANVDSIHFSFPVEYQASVMEELRPGISDKMGDYKIETVASGGLWLEPGRYWLYSDELQRFRNRSVRHCGHAFKDHSIHVVSRLIGDLHIPIRFRVGMERSMSDMWSIKYDPTTGLERQQLAEVSSGASPTDVLRVLEQNRKQHIPRRIQAFKNLASSFENVGARCLETQHNGRNQMTRGASPERGRVRRTLAAGTESPDRSCTENPM